MLSEHSLATTISVATAQGGRTMSSRVCAKGGFKYHRISPLASVDGNVL